LFDPSSLFSPSSIQPDLLTLVLMRCQSAGEIGCFEVSAGFNFPLCIARPSVTADRALLP
jgi:hypothetical protein